MFREKNVNAGFEIGKTGIIPVSVMTIQYRIGNTVPKECLDLRILGYIYV
jgi:hypothetical protein